MKAGLIIAALTGVCPHCGAKARVVIDSEGPNITHIFFDHESWCSVCPIEAGPPEVQ